MVNTLMLEWSVSYIIVVVLSEDCDELVVALRVVLIANMLIV